MPEYIVSIPSDSTVTGSELSEHIRMKLDARAQVEPKSDLFDRIQEHRRLDAAMVEARNRALREVLTRLAGVAESLGDQNYGDAKDQVEHIMTLLSENNDRSQIVKKHERVLA